MAAIMHSKAMFKGVEKCLTAIAKATFSGKSAVEGNQNSIKNKTKTLKENGGLKRLKHGN